MPSIEITPLYAGLIALLMAALATRTALTRIKNRVPLGDGSNDGLALEIRRFGNLAEYAPIAMIVLLLLELKGIPASWLHAFGATFVALRLLHPLSFYGTPGQPKWRVIGRVISTAGTATLLAVGGVGLVVG